MTNVFPNAPDRIWATWKEDFGAVQIGTWADTVRFEPLGAEYIRADLTASDAAKLAEIRALAEAAIGSENLRKPLIAAIGVK